MGLLERLFGQSRGGQQSSAAPTAPPSTADFIAPTRAPGFVVVDVETTGLSPRQHRVIELAVVEISPDGAVVDEWSSRINPEGPVGATHIHGITDADVRGAPLFRDISHDVASRLQGRAVVAHNAKFDVAFLGTEFDRAGWDVAPLPHICTLTHSATHLPGLARRTLAECCVAASIQHRGAHSALGDARATAELFAFYLQNAEWSQQVATEALRLASAVSWPNGPSRAHLAYVPVQGAVPARRFTSSRKPSKSLRSQIALSDVSRAAEETQGAEALPYLEMLLNVMADGVLSVTEAADLSDLAEAYGMSGDDRIGAHQALVKALAGRAVIDGTMSRDELAEIESCGRTLGLTDEQIRAAIEAARQSFLMERSAGLSQLPDGWALGAPLRVGDRVAFTGCDDEVRDRLEEAATVAGVKVQNSVSGLTTMLVTDGSFSGTKRARAEQLGTRIVAPKDFETLIRHIQPATPPTASRKIVPTDGPNTEAVVDMPSAPWDPASVRKWASAQGYQVGERGRLPADLIRRYLASQSSEG